MSVEKQTSILFKLYLFYEKPGECMNESDEEPFLPHQVLPFPVPTSTSTC